MKYFLNTIKYIFLLGIMGGLVWWSFDHIDDKNLEPGEDKLQFILRVFGETDKMWLLVSGLCALMSHYIRAVRWQLLLKPMGYEFKTINGFWAVMNGYIVNLVVPRGGEVSRPVYLKRKEGVPVDVSLGTVIAERVIDLLFLVLCILSVMIFQYNRITGIIYNDSSEPTVGEEKGMGLFSILGIAVVVGGTLLLVLSKIFPNFVKVLVEKAKSFLIGIKGGLLAVFKVEKFGLFVVYSIAIWVLYFLMQYVVMLGFPDTTDISLADTLTVFIVGAIAMSMPMPGGVGSYHKLVPLALIMVQAMDDLGRAVAFVTVFHLWQTIVVIVFGGLSFVFAGKKRLDVNEK